MNPNDFKSTYTKPLGSINDFTFKKESFLIYRDFVCRLEQFNAAYVMGNGADWALFIEANGSKYKVCAFPTHDQAKEELDKIVAEITK